jgi:uncharacterized protein
VPAYATDVDLAALRLVPGEGRRIELAVHIDPVLLAEEAYAVGDDPLPVTLDISRMVGHGYALRLGFAARLEGPCMRCLKDAAPSFEVEAREVNRPGAGEELESPYVEDEVLDLARWARDALVLSIPTTVLCRPDCAGLCPQCAADLNEEPPGHSHERPPDTRWAGLSELEL